MADSQSVVNHADPNPFMRVVMEDPHSLQLNAMQLDGKRASGATFCKDNCLDVFRVIGNLHQHPELLKG